MSSSGSIASRLQSSTCRNRSALIGAPPADYGGPATTDNKRMHEVTMRSGKSFFRLCTARRSTTPKQGVPWKSKLPNPARVRSDSHYEACIVRTHGQGSGMMRKNTTHRVYVAGGSIALVSNSQFYCSEDNHLWAAGWYLTTSGGDFATTLFSLTPALRGGIPVLPVRIQVTASAGKLGSMVVPRLVA